MSGLQIKYSKELAKELTKIGVVLPGEPVSIGDIIHFPYGKKGTWPFRQPAPRGSFNVISSLTRLGIDAAVSDPDTDPDPYIFSSRRSVEIDFELGAEGAGAGGAANASGKLTARFKSEGSVYFAAVDCKTRRLENIADVAVNLNDHSNRIVWRDTFLVTSITVADKALIMQSSTESANLEILGDVKGLVTKKAGDIAANTSLSVNKFSQASFVKPWSENVTVFFGLHRFRKKDFGFDPSLELAAINRMDVSEYAMLASDFINDDNDTYELRAVSALELLDEVDVDET